ncbi:MAG: hypothetical protein KKA62_02640 [Nanoarchaeota archaeon]|nr:hypothetical protein [Nanoarchaeota archaeon]MBU1644536.1 hypothetical protein [Nanoarchaeota archaeon]MBU1976829.1 hypothetical protein [Nanoarchaeota archaeon]
MATLLLISFAVALGVVIMNFGRAQVESEAECPVNIGLQLSVVSKIEQVCYNSGENDLFFTVENGVNTEVDGLIVNIIGTEKAETFEMPETRIGKAGVYLGHVSYDQSVSGEIRQVKISPKVKLYEEEEICVDQAIVLEEIKEC